MGLPGNLLKWEENLSLRFLFGAHWNESMMAGASAALLDHEVEAMY